MPSVEIPQETPFLSTAPVVRLEKAFTSPFRNVVATARTCYSSKGIVEDGAIQLGLFPETRDTQIARSIYEAGHHTTFQHAQFQFTLDNVSRHFLWSFLHQHPFYNSEQVSQRYVRVKPGNVVVPPLTGEALEIYEETVAWQHGQYRELIAELMEPATEAYYRRFPYRAKYPERYVRDVRKKAQEVARYVLPIGTFAYLYHTVSGLTLMRYWRMCRLYDVPHEQRMVVGAMVRELLRHDENYAMVLEEPMPLEATPEFEFMQRFHEGRCDVATRFIQRFDASLEGRTSRLVDYSAHGETTMAESVREMLGVTPEELDDDNAIGLVLDPSRNPILGENLSLTTHAKLTRAMHHPHYTFRRRISHTADSQDQRHRMTPGSRPVFAAQCTDEPDYITPELIGGHDPSRRRYREVMERTWSAVERLRALGVPAEFTSYLLPNAVSIRYTESSDLLNLHHKLKMRLCYNAQEEIWRASVDEALQVREVHPRIGAWLLPPCTIRFHAKQRPICPEGERFCGEKVWKIDVAEFERMI